jgi:hypothetical protein
MGARIPTLLNRADGAVLGVNPKRLNEIPYWLMTNRNATNPPTQNALVIAASQSSPPTVMSISGEGPCAVYAFTAQRTGVARVLLQIQDGPKIRGLMNRACHIDTIFGSYTPAAFGNRAYYLPEALFMDEERSVIATVTDISAVANTVRLNMEAQRLLSRQYDHQLANIRARMDKRQYLTLPHFYTFDNGSSTLAAAIGATNTETITISGEFHFELFKLTAVAQQGLGSFSWNIQDAVTGETLVDMPQGSTGNIGSGLSIGNASFPFTFHEPRFFSIRTKLIVTLVNRVAAANQIFLTLGGRDLADRLWS